MGLTNPEKKHRRKSQSEWKGGGSYRKRLKIAMGSPTGKVSK